MKKILKLWVKFKKEREKSYTAFSDMGLRVDPETGQILISPTIEEFIDWLEENYETK